MSNPLDPIAHALLDKALALPGVRGGRTGEGGPVPETPYVEVGDGQSTLEPLGGAGCQREQVGATFYVVFYVRFDGADPEARKAELRELVWGYRSSLLADLTLAGTVESARVQGWDIDLTERNRTQYWYAALEVEVQFEA